ncbi:MYG1 family protein [Nakamurella antarctica]|uniref:MYG1 family protein n=1 Tax=Nakamurella antarctica TaxID=1902245 RepID=A0A3G8ZLG7_9ACTN|nr:MYG1 family protein [Nakamurella antarctica]AZI58172.1 MYG1 family protein [Nakamurella antarctica]
MIIATHNGKFHADDVLGVALLRHLHPDATVVRTRDETVLAAADIVLDVGGIFDVESRRFDHHQLSSGARTNGILYSAFGLLWREYGTQFCDGDEKVSRRIDSRLVESIDAVDNGQDLYTLNEFNTLPFDISSVLGLLNPIDGLGEANFDDQFDVAVQLATQILLRLKAKFSQDEAAEKLFLERYQATPDPRYLVLDAFVPHGRIASVQPELLYTMFPNTNGGWTIQTVRPNGSQFGSRKPFPQAWRGLSGAELGAETGVSDAVFCHKAGFIAAAQSRTGAEELLRLAIADSVNT